jgi:hypothetical protein
MVAGRYAMCSTALVEHGTASNPTGASAAGGWTTRPPQLVGVTSRCSDLARFLRSQGAEGEAPLVE